MSRPSGPSVGPCPAGADTRLTLLIGVIAESVYQWSWCQDVDTGRCGRCFTLISGASDGDAEVVVMLRP